MHVSFLVPIVLTFLSRKTGNASFTQKKKQQQQKQQQQKNVILNVIAMKYLIPNKGNNKITELRTI